MLRRASFHMTWKSKLSQDTPHARHMMQAVMMMMQGGAAH
jgi:hypothetical protein